MTQLWALIVGIEKYGTGLPEKYQELDGAAEDCRKVLSYLVNKRGVKQENIKSLVNRYATRDAIISTFRSHLIDNPDIQKGDAILFHYSGHGSRGTVPEGWAVTAKDGLLETIIPYDDGEKDSTGQQICGIPDRVLGALVGAVTRKHGQNMTVVTDCCHSSSGIRGGDDSIPDTEKEGRVSARNIPTNLGAPLRDDIDKELLSALKEPENHETKQKLKISGFRDIQRSGVVLMAAAGQMELSYGTNDGGWFTGEWIKALEDNTSPMPKTYAEILGVAGPKVTALWEIGHRDCPSNVREPPQHPACEGPAGRIVFTETTRAPHSFVIEPSTDAAAQDVCRINGGQAHGVQVGTEFELQELGKNFGFLRTIGSAVATEVDANTCTAKLPLGFTFPNALCVAVMKQPPWRVKFSISVAGSARDSNDAIETWQSVTKKLEEAPKADRGFLDQKQPGDLDVDLRLEVETDGAITFHRTRPVYELVPRMTKTQALKADIVGVLRSVAQFNWNWAHTNDGHPLSKDIILEFEQAEGPPGAKERFRFSGDEITLDQNDYVFVLQNNTKSDLYPYVVFFDPDSYAVSMRYSPPDSRRAEIFQNKESKIGGGELGSEPFRLWLSEDDPSQSNVMLMKIYFFTKFVDDLGVNQAGLFENDESVQRGTASDPKGVWDTLDVKIVLRR